MRINKIVRQQFHPIESTLGFCDESRKEKIVQFVEQLLNNNAPGYFFLFREPDAGLGEDHCIFLQLSIALKAELHYGTLLEAKILQLSESFQHKLGFLVGNSYARVGTEDWVPKQMTAEEFQEEARRRVNEVESALWVDHAVHKAVLKRMLELPEEARTPEALKAAVEATGSEKASRRKQALALVRSVLQSVEVGPDTIDRTLDRLEDNPEFRSLIK